MGGSVWDFDDFFLNQLLTGQHLANSGESQLKKSPCKFIQKWFQLQNTASLCGSNFYWKAKDNFDQKNNKAKRRIPSNFQNHVIWEGKISVSQHSSKTQTSYFGIFSGNCWNTNMKHPNEIYEASLIFCMIVYCISKESKVTTRI